MAWSRIVIATVIFVVGVTCGPIDVEVPATDLIPPKIDEAADYLPRDTEEVPAPATDLLPPEEDNLPTLATDLMPPPLPEKTKPTTLFLINVFAVKNSTGDETNDVLHDDVIEEVPDDIAEPLAVFLLVVEDADEDHPVSLDEVAKDLEEEGFTIEKVTKDGETRLIKVDLASVETSIKEIEEQNRKSQENNSNAIEKTNEEPALEESGKLMKIRRKRTICLSCKLEELKQKKHHHGYGGGCNTCGGGGGYYGPQVQPYPQYVPTQVIQVQPYPQQYRPVQVVQPQPQQCNTCGGGGGQHYAQGGGQSSAYATASASASANSYGGK